jgi:hypothetical protein
MHYSCAPTVMLPDHSGCRLRDKHPTGAQSWTAGHNHRPCLTHSLDKLRRAARACVQGAAGWGAGRGSEGAAAHKRQAATTPH